MVSRQVGAVLTILGGVFYVIGAFIGWIAAAGFFFGLFGSFTTVTTSPYPYTTPQPSFNFGALGTALLLIIGFGIFTGIMIIIGGALLNSDTPGRRKSGGILAITMMVFGGLPTLGGLGIGFLFTLVGAILGLTYKESNPDILIGYQPIPSTAPPAAQSIQGAPGSLPPQNKIKISQLGRMILQSMSQGRTLEEVVQTSGVDEAVIREKFANLKSGGFLTETGKLTEKGYEALQSLPS